MSTVAARTRLHPNSERSPATRIAASLMRGVARRPGRVLVVVAVTGGAGVFGWNALVRQPSPHPAPLFANAAPPSVAPVEPPPRPATLAAASPAQAPDRPARTDSIVAAKGGEAAKKPAGADPIGSLLRSTETPPRQATATPEAKPAAVPRTPAAQPRAPAVAAPAAETKAPTTPRVIAAQKALSKLGYGPIDADGHIGSTTRQALERFERDRKLPVTGALGPKTSKQLAALSGFAVE